MAAAPRPNEPAKPPNRRISVVHLLHTIEYGGIETVLINWLGKIDRERFDVHLVCFANPGGTERPFIEAAGRAGIDAETVPWSRRKPVFKSARRLREILRRHGADILHTHNVYADLVGAWAARRDPARTLTTLYVWDDFGWKRNLLQRINRWVLRYFDVISAHCEDTLRKTREMGCADRDIKLLIAGFESNRVEMASEKRQRLRRRRGVEDDDVLLANIARLHPEKAQDSLLRSFRRVREACPNARLWILGVGPLEQRLRTLCTELGLDDRVTFVGFVDDLPGILPLIDIQVHPSHAEGVPLAICSGMAAGLPIVASRVGGLPEVLDHGRNGVLVQPGDDEAFAEAVIKLVRDPRRRRDLGDAARRFIETDYSLDTAVRKLEETYEQMTRTGCVKA